MTLYNGLTLEQLDNLTRSMNILSDCAKNIQTIESVNEFKKNVLAPIYSIVVKNLQEELKKIHKESELKIIGADSQALPEYLLAALKKFNDERISANSGRVKEIKEQIEKYNIWMTPSNAPTTKKVPVPAGEIDSLVKMIIQAVNEE